MAEQSESCAISAGLNTVLFDALQIPAGMHPFCWIPQDSSEMEPESSGMGLDSTRF